MSSMPAADESALATLFDLSGVAPDAEVAGILAADFARLREIARVVHAVREADEYDPVLVFNLEGLRS